LRSAYRLHCPGERHVLLSCRNPYLLLVNSRERADRYGREEDLTLANVTRRSALLGSGVGLGLLAFAYEGGILWRTPGEARADKVALKSLTTTEVTTIEAFGEALVPGAREAGISHYVDHHISNAPADSLLMLRYLDVPPPYLDFYRPGLAALERFARATKGQDFAGLSPDKAFDVVRAISNPDPAAAPKDWTGPPASLFYFAVRADAIDVVYGTEAAAEKLGLPYMAHILPETPW
jgi:Gluconate 2-dehydrogenase subunit 3